MKKNIFIVTLIFSVFLVSCFNPVISMIREEVELEEAVVNGTINSIVRYTGKYGDKTGDYLFIQNGNIAYKPAAIEYQKYGEWEYAPYIPPPLEYDIYTDTFNGAQIIKLAVGGDGSGNNTLFALGINYRTDTGSTIPADKILYKLTNENPPWKEIYRRPSNIPENSNERDFDDNFAIFCTNSPQPEHRRAFARIGTGEDRKTQKYFELTEGTDWSDESKLDEHGVPKSGDETGIAPTEFYNSVLFINGDVYFSPGRASGTNETATEDATYAYWSEGSTLHWCDEASITTDKLVSKGSLSSANQIYSLAINLDSIIVGRYNTDVQRVGIENNGTSEAPNYTGKPTDFINFESNAKSQLRGPYSTNVLFSLDPAKTEEENVIYASLILRGSESSSSGSIQAVGLWSYYPARGNWNRE